MHTGSAGALFSLLAAYALRSGGIEARSYLAGYLCHYCLDSFAHPYVYFHERALGKTYPRACASGRHALIESHIDAWFRDKFYPEHFDIDDFTNYDAAMAARLHKLYAHCLPKLGVACPNTPEFERCLRGARGFLRLLFSAAPPLVAVARLLEEAMGKPMAFTGNMRPKNPDLKWLNFNHAEWRDFDDIDTPRRDSFLELFNGAAEKAKSMLNALNDAASGRRAPEFDAAARFDAGSYERH